MNASRIAEHHIQKQIFPIIYAYSMSLPHAPYLICRPVVVEYAIYRICIVLVKPRHVLTLFIFLKGREMEGRRAIMAIEGGLEQSLCFNAWTVFVQFLRILVLTY